MTDTLQPYPTYKPTGVPWLSKIPAHWDAPSVKRHYHIQLGKMLQNTAKTPGDILVPYLKAQHVQWSGVMTTDLPRMWASPAEVIKFGVGPGDLLVCEGGEGGRSGLLMGVNGPVIIQNALHRVRPAANCCNEFLQYIMSAVSATGWFDAINNKATIAHFTRDKFGALGIPFAPLIEQLAIVRFLGGMDRQINITIKAKRKLMALLNEQKQAIIYRAVTHGLNDTVPLKPSGVEWLGDIPKHWSIQRAKTLFRLRTQKSGNQHGLELLALYTHIGVRPRKDLEQRGNKASTTDDYWIVKKGDIVVNKLLAWMGAVGVSNYDGVTSPAYDILMPITEVVPDFYHLLFRTKLYLQQFKQRSRGIMDMRLRLYFDQLGQIPLLVPPPGEQAAIVTFCVDATADLDRAIGVIEREITLLRECRTRLVADVVTGKLDVRAAASRFPIDNEEAEVLGMADDDNDICESDSEEVEPIMEAEEV